ncbi:hypothetical protein ACP70R_039137 [Stipagrostis hirtigluma subsp. patula]
MEWESGLLGSGLAAAFPPFYARHGGPSGSSSSRRLGAWVADLEELAKRLLRHGHDTAIAVVDAPGADADTANRDVAFRLLPAPPIPDDPATDPAMHTIDALQLTGPVHPLLDLPLLSRPWAADGGRPPKRVHPLLPRARAAANQAADGGRPPERAKEADLEVGRAPIVRSGLPGSLWE